MGSSQSRARLIGNLDIDRQDRALGAAIHLDLDPVRIDRDVPADHCENLRAQDCDQIGMAAHVAFVFKQNLQLLPP